MSEKILCGCECHEIDPDDTNRVILSMKTWHPLCALRDSIRQLGLANEELENIRTEVVELRKAHTNYKLLLSKIESMICPNCFHPVKENWSFVEGGVFCTACAQEMMPVNPFSDLCGCHG
jgi:hypothetical protein